MKKQGFISSYVSLFSKEIILAGASFTLSIIIVRSLGPGALGVYGF